MKVLLGEKKEMTQVFMEDGTVVPVTLVDVNDVFVVGKKSMEKDGYETVVIGKGKKLNPTKPEQGKYKELGFVPKFVIEAGLIEMQDTGTKLPVSLFDLQQKVEVVGTSKSKGFQGVVKRHGFQGGPKTHGQSDRHRAPGSIGNRTIPGRVFKGKRMAGRMGGDQITVKNLVIVAVDETTGLIAIKGAVPGNKGSFIIIRAK